MKFTRLIIPLFLVVNALACSSTNQVLDAGIEYMEVPVPDQFINKDNPRPDVWAKYPGGKENLDWYIRMNTRIPEQARKEGYEGRILLSYEVDEVGRAGNIEALMSPHQAITDMYRDIISDMERWKPAVLKSSPVSQRYYIIASFQAGSLQDSESN